MFNDTPNVPWIYINSYPGRPYGLVGETQNSSTPTNKFTIPNWVDFYKEKGNTVLERSRGWGKVVREGFQGDDT